MSSASGRLTVQKVIWNSLCTQKKSRTHWRPRYPSESHCATVRCSYPTLGPRNRPCEERLEILCSHPIAATIWSNGNKERPSVLRWPSNVARKSGSCSRPSSSFGGISEKKSGTGIVSDAAQNTLNTGAQSWQGLYWARVVWKSPRTAFVCSCGPALDVAPHCTVVERHSTDGSQDLGFLQGSRLPQNCLAPGASLRPMCGNRLTRTF